MKKPTVAIVGRPNVGKSTLFNRLVEKRLAIVDDQPGVTRDRLYKETEWAGHHFMLIDTGGLVPETEDKMERIIAAQVEIAISEADVIVLLVDCRIGLLPQDKEISNLLKRVDTPVILAVNKADNDTFALGSHEFYRLGLGEPYPISALQGVSTGDLLDKIVEHFPAGGSTKASEDALKLAIVGKPNVGKSSLVNALLRTERVIVDNVPGTTRDSIDTPIRYQGKEYILTDTAGIRRKQKVEDGVEYYSTIRALQAVSRCDIALVMVDAEKGLTKQDMVILEEVVEAGRGIILVVNKWDLLEKDNDTFNRYMEKITNKLGRYRYIPIVFVSVLERQRITKPLEMALKVHQAWSRRVGTSDLNRLLEQICAERSFFTNTGKQIKLNYCTQVATMPPTFSFFTNFPDQLKDSSKRFIERNLRKRFDFEGTPLKLLWKTKH